MRSKMASLMGAVGLIFLVAAGVSVAGPNPDKPIPPEKQKELLKQHGEEGIDANGDGTLTHDEVRSFFVSKRNERRGAKGDEKANAEQSLRRDVSVLRTLEMFCAKTPPNDFDAARIPGADSDHNGKLSPDEWQAFAEPRCERLRTRLAETEPTADADEDGAINDEELKAFSAKTRERVLAGHPEVDKNRDGKVSDEEFAAFGARDAKERHQPKRAGGSNKP